MASACYIASYAYEPPQEKASWFVKASDEDKKLYTRVIDSANFRASQTGKKWSRSLSDVELMKNMLHSTAGNNFKHSS